MKSSTQDTVKIMRQGGEVLVYDMELVDKITRWSDGYRKVKPQREKTDYSQYYDRGYFCGVDATPVGIGLGDWKPFKQSEKIIY